MKGLSFIVILLLLLGLLGGGHGAGRDYGPLRWAAYSSGGGMDGGYTNWRLEPDESGQLFLTTEECRMIGMPVVISTYRAEGNALEELRALAEKHDIPSWEKLPMSDIIALDAPTQSVTLGFEKDSFRVSYNQKLTNKGREVLREAEGLIGQFAAEDRLISCECQNGSGRRLGDFEPYQAEAREAFLRLCWTSSGFTSLLNDDRERVMFTYEGQETVAGEEVFVFRLTNGEAYAIGAGYGPVYCRTGDGAWTEETA